MTSPWDVGAGIVGDRVYDSNGRKLGFVRGIDPGNAMLDIELSPRAARRLGAQATFLRVPLQEVLTADEHDVTLRDSGEFLVKPDRRPMGSP